MNGKQTNTDEIYGYSSFKQFCLPAIEFPVRSYVYLGTEMLLQ